MSAPLSIRAKLPLFIFLIIVVALSISTILIIRTSQTVISYVKTGRIEDFAQSVGHSVTVQLQRAGKDMVLAAGLPTVLQGIELPPGKGNASDRIPLTALLTRLKMACGYYESLYLTNNEGIPLAGVFDETEVTPDAGKRLWFLETMAKNTVVVAYPFVSPATGDALLPISLKLVYNGKTGALIGTLQLAKITRVSLRDASPRWVKAFVVAEDGRIVAALDSDESGADINGKADWFHEAQARVSGSLTTMMDGRLKTVGFYHIPQTNLYSVVIADAEYMQSFIRTIRNMSMGTGALIAVLAVGSLCLLVFPVTRDIKKLSLFARQITEGAQETDTGVSRPDELGDLADSLSRMVSTLHEMLLRSDAATRAKSEFLARMSHEIRTPMNGIIGMTYLAMRDNPDGKQMRYLQRIDNAAKSLLGVINDILDFSKMEANKMQLASNPFYLEELLQSVYDLVQVKSREKGLELAFSTADGVPRVLIGDALRLAQVCVNICTNGVKFTERGGVSLRVAVAEKRKEDIVLLFTVRDTGIGVSVEEQEHIFDSFSQADGSTTRKYGGTGLGLAICKSLVQMMGGAIRVESEPGRGSVFSFTVAMREGTEADMRREEAPFATEPVSSPLRVLLAEDNEINQEIALEILQDMGVSVSIAADGLEAVKLFEAEDFDLILMDIQMPRMDGLTATARIRRGANPKGATVPILAMTANAMSGDKEKSLEAGMNDHITKPLDVTELRNALLRWGYRREAP